MYESTRVRGYEGTRVRGYGGTGYLKSVRLFERSVVRSFLGLNNSRDSTDSMDQTKSVRLFESSGSAPEGALPRRVVRSVVQCEPISGPLLAAPWFQPPASCQLPAGLLGLST
jgi:hypothetical protein